MTLLLKNALTQKQTTTLNYSTSLADEDDSFEKDSKTKIQKEDIFNLFEKFTSSLRTAKHPQDFLTLEEFESMEFEREDFPEIIHDVLLYLADYKIIYNVKNT